MRSPTRDVRSSDGGSRTAVEGLARWVTQNLRWLKRQLKRPDRNEQDVDDLIQEAILRVAESCERHEIRDSASVMVRTVTRLSINDCRNRERHPYEAETIEELDKAIQLVDPTPLPEDVVALEQSWDLIARVLQTLDERTRRAFLLNRVQGLKYPEVARQLGVSLSTVEKDVTWVMALLIDAAQDRPRIP
jgi:RNA polymerase sigma factor (sigma-70 family)